MTQRRTAATTGITPTKAIATRVRELRGKRGWTAQQLADEMGKVGVPWAREVVANLETGRRASLSVEELLALAYVLHVAPVHLLVPLDNATPYAVTPHWTAGSGPVREWVRGGTPLPNVDRRIYDTEVPAEEWSPPATAANRLMVAMRDLIDAGVVTVTHDADKNVTTITPKAGADNG